MVILMIYLKKIIWDFSKKLFGRFLLILLEKNNSRLIKSIIEISKIIKQINLIYLFLTKEIDLHKNWLLSHKYKKGLFEKIECKNGKLWLICVFILFVWYQKFIEIIFY